VKKGITGIIDERGALHVKERTKGAEAVRGIEAPAEVLEEDTEEAEVGVEAGAGAQVVIETRARAGYLLIEGRKSKGMNIEEETGIINLVDTVSIGMIQEIKEI
jgi:hypothetical protein